MKTSQLRIDLPFEQLDTLKEHLKKYSSTYVIGHEFKKITNDPHFHVHFEHKVHLDTVRRYFRKEYPLLVKMGLYFKTLQKTEAESIAYVIKNNNYTYKGYTEATIDISRSMVKVYKEEEHLKTLRDKILYRLNQVEDNDKWFVNTEVMANILFIFKEKRLSYPSQSWIKQCIVSYWMQDPTRNYAIQNIEKIYNINDPFIKDI